MAQPGRWREQKKAVSKMLAWERLVSADLDQFTLHQKGCETLKQKRRYRPELSHHGRVTKCRRRNIRSEVLEKAK